MRLALAAGIAAVFVLAGLAVGSPLVHSVPAPRTSAHSAPGGVREAPSHPDLTIPRNIRFGLLNATLPVHSAVGGPPTSSVPETPSPVLPSTVPTEISFPQSVVTCCVYANFTAPTGPWAAIEFTDTGTVVGSVYDSSYRAYIDGAQFLEGTTPEYGTWTVHSDLTQYSALFRGTVNLTFILSAATLGGHFVTNVSLAFYPVPAGTAAPQTPTDVVPLWAWDHTYLHAANAKVFANATIPANVTNATLQLFVYGFGPTDEFWYSAQPGFRQAMVSVDGAILSAVYPFPYLNTGGIDLFLWRPVTSDFTINDRPYDVDVSGSIGLLEGTHEFVANVSGGLDGNTWLVGGSLLLYTASNAGAATSTQYAVERVPVSHQSGATYDDSSSTTTLTTSSTFDLGKAPVNVTTDLAESFSNQQTFTQGASSVQNVSQDERLTTVSYENSTNSSVVTERSLHFPLVLNLSNSQVKVSSTATTTTYNFTSAISEFHQEWQESDATGNGTATAINGPTARVDDLTTAQGAYSGQETANNAGGGATIDALFGSVSAISKSYTASVLGGSPSWTYTHLLTAAGNNPPGPFNAQTLLTNSVSDPMTAAAAAVPSTIDLGGTAELSAWGVGGDGQYHFAWLGLPMGCRSTDSATLHCIPSAAGSYSPSVTVTDAGTNATTVALGPLVVEPRLTVGVQSDRTAWDADQVLTVSATISGGTGVDERCEWFVNETAFGPPQGCDLPVNLTGVAGSPTTAEVKVTDSTGSVANSSVVAYTPQEAPIATLAQTAADGTALRNAGGLEFNVTILGGSAPYQIAWSINGLNVTGANSNSLVWIPAKPGNVTAIAWVTDAANLTVSSAPLTASGGSPTRSNGSPSTASTPAPDETGWYVAAVVAAGAVAMLILVLVLLQSPRRPPRVGGRSNPRGRPAHWARSPPP